MSATLHRPISKRTSRTSGSAPGAHVARVDAAPAFVRLANPLLIGLLRVGVPMGPNLLMTVRGRTTGQPRVAPVAVIEIDGRRYVMGAYGAVNWVRNLRTAGEAVLRIHGHDQRVTARELDHDASVRFYRETLPEYIRHFPWYGRAFARVFFGLVGPELANDPVRAAELHPVFELSGQPAGRVGSPVRAEGVTYGGRGRTARAPVGPHPVGSGRARSVVGPLPIPARRCGEGCSTALGRRSASAGSSAACPARRAAKRARRRSAGRAGRSWR